MQILYYMRSRVLELLSCDVNVDGLGNIFLFFNGLRRILNVYDQVPTISVLQNFVQKLKTIKFLRNYIRYHPCQSKVIATCTVRNTKNSKTTQFELHRFNYLIRILDTQQALNLLYKSKYLICGVSNFDMLRLRSAFYTVIQI